MLLDTDWSALDLLPDPAVVLDETGVVRHANPGARALIDANGRDVHVLDALPQLRATPFERRLAELARKRGVQRFAARFGDPRLEGSYDVTLTAVDGGALVVFHRRATGAPPAGTRDASRVAEGLVEAGMALSSALSLEQVLQVLVDVARELVGARYAALGVVNAERSGLSDFITSGLTPQQRARMGDLPTGHGILGLLVRDARPIRLKDLRDHPVSAGVPPHHPPMRSFLGVPVLAKDRVFGNLYVTEKIGAEEFTDDDMALTETLAIQAAIAIDNAQLRRERDRFFAAASHELGNALAAVRLWSGHLLRTAPESRDEWVDGVSKIRGSAELAHRLIQDLLSLSRIQEGRLTLSAWPADIHHLVEDVVAQVGAEAEECAVVVEAEMPDAELPIETDATRVRQILMNLLSNALKVSSAGGRVHVGFEATPGGGVHAWVRDEGPGIAPADMERIFQPFEQVEVVARGRGAGLGLALSRQLARLLGGDLTADSAPGAGATFHLRLPRVMPAGTGGG